MVSLGREDWILVAPHDLGHVTLQGTVFPHGKLRHLHLKIIVESKRDKMEIYSVSPARRKKCSADVGLMRHHDRVGRAWSLDS